MSHALRARYRQDFDEDVIMDKKNDYSRARKRIGLAIMIVHLATAVVKFVIAVQPLLSVAFNYLKSSRDELRTKVDAPVQAKI